MAAQSTHNALSAGLFFNEVGVHYGSSVQPTLYPPKVGILHKDQHC